MLKSKKQYVRGAYHIKNHYGNDLPLYSFKRFIKNIGRKYKFHWSLNKVINWTKYAYTYLDDNFTVCDKIKIMYIYKRIT